MKLNYHKYLCHFRYRGEVSIIAIGVKYNCILMSYCRSCWNGLNCLTDATRP